MKETLTLLERCQREAREKLQDFDFEQIWSDEGAEKLNLMVDTLIANTLKQAAEALEGMKKDISGDVESATGFPEAVNYGYTNALTDAQRLLES